MPERLRAEIAALESLEREIALAMRERRDALYHELNGLGERRRAGLAYHREPDPRARFLDRAS
jgi:hypothetical protein